MAIKIIWKLNKLKIFCIVPFSIFIKCQQDFLHAKTRCYLLHFADDSCERKFLSMGNDIKTNCIEKCSLTFIKYFLLKINSLILNDNILYI